MSRLSPQTAGVQVSWLMRERSWSVGLGAQVGLALIGIALIGSGKRLFLRVLLTSPSRPTFFGYLTGASQSQRPFGDIVRMVDPAAT